MIFPDARTRVPTPVLTNAAIRALKQRAYKMAAVDLSAFPQFSFTFLRPPGWRVGAPVMSSKSPMPMPPLASFTRRQPSVFMDLLVHTPSHDCLPGDFLDAHLDGLTLSHRSEGPLGDGWYADRMGRTETGYAMLAAHRKGKHLFLFLCAMPVAAAVRVREELAALVATFALRDNRQLPYAERWRRQADANTHLSFALPVSARVQSGLFGLEAGWSSSGGQVELTVRPLPANEADHPRIEAGFRQELLRRGLRIGPARVGDLPASTRGVFEGDVAIRLYESLPSSHAAIEALLLVGTRKDGRRVRVTGTYPCLARNPDLWMRARFAFVQIAATMKPFP